MTDTPHAPSRGSRLAKVAVERGLGRHLRTGHPWVYRRALIEMPGLPPGAIVDVVDDGKFAARGYFDPSSPIAIRVLTTDPSEVIDMAFFERRVRRAWDMRARMVDTRRTDSFRLLHGEADLLPGVVVDWYAGFAVLKLYSAGLTAARSMLLAALRSQIPGLKGVVGRDVDDADEDGPQGVLLEGTAPTRPLQINENGVQFAVDVYAGQKTGFFLDQRDNRALVRSLASGATVLNCFCYSGGFSVNAALGGATAVFSVDRDVDAIALARQNFTLNGLAPAKHDFLAADVSELLASLKAEKRTFDLVVLDPPAFAKNQKSVEAAIDGYASLNRQALGVLAKGGLLCTASCSARVTPEVFYQAIRDAARNANTHLTLLQERFQPPDHPIALEFPEGKYLKFYVLRKE